MAPGQSAIRLAMVRSHSRPQNHVSPLFATSVLSPDNFPARPDNIVRRRLATNLVPRRLKQIQTVRTTLATTSRALIYDGCLRCAPIRIRHPNLLPTVACPVGHIGVERDYPGVWVIFEVAGVGTACGAGAVVILDVACGIAGHSGEADVGVGLPEEAGFEGLCDIGGGELEFVGTRERRGHDEHGEE